jgi:ankyrin repeat protein
MAQLKVYAQQQVIANVVDEDGNRPLHCAILAGNRPMIVLILYYMFQAKRSESIMRRNNAGFTPVELAVVKSPTQLLPLLFNFATPKYK